MTVRLMNTINETFERAQAENIGVSKNFIRQAVRSGSLPCVRAGVKQSKYLINYNSFLSFLENPPPVMPSEPDAGGIRKIGR